MPAISPTQLRTMAQNLSRHGALDRAAVNQLIDASLDAGGLRGELKAELSKILAEYSDRFSQTDGAGAKLKSFLSIEDPQLQALSHRLEVDDGVISLADAQLLTGVARRDGDVSLGERFSMAALLAGTRLDDSARAHLANAARLQTVAVPRAPDMQIPDDDARGLSDTARVNVTGKLADVSVDLDIEHTYRGDLVVTLEAPDGTSVVLHNRAGRSADDLKGSFPQSLTPAEPLSSLVGKDAKGDWKLHVKDLAGRDVGALKSWSLNLAVDKTEAPGQTLDLTGGAARFRPTHLTTEGIFVSDPSIAQPSVGQRATGLFHMADLIDDKKTNPFKDAALPLAMRDKVLNGIQQALQDAPATGNAAPGLSTLQALQMRSSAVTVLLGLLEATGNSGEELVLKNKCFMAYRQALQAETDPTLKDSMIWNLHNAARGAPPAMRDKIEDIVAQIAPAKPPYDDWFKNGNDTLNVAWTCGPDTEFFPGTINILEKNGYKKEDPNATRPPLVLVRNSQNQNGDDINVRIHVTVNRGDQIFAKMDDDDFQIVGYDGHSNFGRNIPASLRRAPSSDDKKLIFYGLCAGKDNLHNVREKYPDAQVITTFNSSYFNTSGDGANKVMTRSENLNVLMELVDGAVGQKSWKQINRGIRDEAILYPWHHPMPGGHNYISPIHTDIRRRNLDSDHDGQVDYLDKLVTFDAQRVATDTAREFTAVDPGRAADILDGTVPHMATMGLNTGAGYNQLTKKWKKGNVIGGGYFEPKPEDAGKIVKFERANKDGEDIMMLTVNKQYAHMSVEALRAVAQYELLMEIAPDRSTAGGLDDVTAKLSALTFATASLIYDTGSWSRDRTIWRSLLEHFNLPPNLDFNTIRNLVDAEKHDYTGNLKHVSEWKKTMDAETLADLARPEVGVPS